MKICEGNSLLRRVIFKKYFYLINDYCLNFDQINRFFLSLWMTSAWASLRFVKLNYEANQLLKYGSSSFEQRLSEECLVSWAGSNARRWWSISQNVVFFFGKWFVTYIHRDELEKWEFLKINHLHNYQNRLHETHFWFLESLLEEIIQHLRSY